MYTSSTSIATSTYMNHQSTNWGTNEMVGNECRTFQLNEISLIFAIWFWWNKHTRTFTHLHAHERGDRSKYERSFEQEKSREKQLFIYWHWQRYFGACHHPFIIQLCAKPPSVYSSQIYRRPFARFTLKLCNLHCTRYTIYLLSPDPLAACCTNGMFTEILLSLGQIKQLKPYI